MVCLKPFLKGTLQYCRECLHNDAIAAAVCVGADFGDQSAILGLLLVLLAKLLGTGVFLMNVDVLGRRPLLLSGECNLQC